MASLSGTTIQSTYVGLLKTTDNGTVGATGKAITDGLGNAIPMEVSSAGITFTGTVTGDNNTTYSLDTAQSGSDATITLTGSDASTDSITLAAGANITLTEAGDTITIEAAGGGGGISYAGHYMGTGVANSSSTDGPYTFFNNTTLFNLIKLDAGTIDAVAYQVNTASASANQVRIALYNAGNTSTTTSRYGTPSTLVHDFGLFDTSATGEVFVTGFSVPVAAGNYYFAVNHAGSWDTGFSKYDLSAAETEEYQFYTVNPGNTQVGTPVYYDTFSQGTWTPPATITAGLSGSSGRPNIYFRLS